MTRDPGRRLAMRAEDAEGPAEVRVDDEAMLVCSQMRC